LDQSVKLLSQRGFPVNPKVSIIIPCYNERETILLLLDSILHQTFDPANLEVVVADGMSEDGTRERIRQFSSEHPELSVRLVDNPERIIPAALNKAISVAQGDVIIRLDAHSIPADDYVERCLEVLMTTGAANVGGVWNIRPASDLWISRAIATAAAHWIGAGDARYRIRGEAGPVDTVPFGAFSRSWLDSVGQFNEQLLTNEDYEYNVRIRQSGGEVWFDPGIESTYFARESLSELAKQYSRYGFWKAAMIRRYPETLRWRQLLPPLFVASLILLSALSLVNPLAPWILGVQLGAYALITILLGVGEAFRKRDVAILIGFAPAIWTMHLTWGASFLWGLFGGHRTR
jgi:glycosyltransferase involved in cell wall biosynthesis